MMAMMKVIKLESKKGMKNSMSDKEKVMVQINEHILMLHEAGLYDEEKARDDIKAMIQNDAMTAEQILWGTFQNFEMAAAFYHTIHELVAMANSVLATHGLAPMHLTEINVQILKEVEEHLGMTTDETIDYLDDYFTEVE